MKRSSIVLIAAAFMFVASLASAQSIANPRQVEFDPSADHSATLETGQPAVTGYVLQFYQAGATAPFQTLDLGKPNPQGDGKIRYDFSSTVVGMPLPGGTYESRVSAVGPGGTGLSDPSNTFTIDRTVYCGFTLTSSGTSVASGGATGTVALTTGSGCTWTASSNASWLTLSAASGSGSATITWTATANGGASTRTATITAGGQTLTLTQAAAPCTFTLSSSGTSIVAAGGTGTVTVTTSSGCSWTAGDDASWLSLSPTSGSGTGTVTWTATANGGASTRTATITAGGQTLALTQSGVACTFTVTPLNSSHAWGGGTTTLAITAAAGCAWTATPGASWLNVSASNGNGNGNVTLTVGMNNSSNARTGTAAVAGATVTINQSARIPGTPRNVRITSQ